MSPGKDAMTFLKQVLEFIEQGKKKQALEHLRSTKLADPFQLIQRQLEAELLCGLGEKDRAEWCYLAIIREYPTCLESKFALAQLYQKSDRFSQALHLLEEVLTQDPLHYMSWNNKGTIFVDLKEPRQAETCYLKALEIKKDYTIAMNNLCALYVQTGEYEKAIAMGEQVLALNVYLAPTYHHLVKAHEHLNQQQQASMVLEKAASYNINLINFE